MLAPLDDGALRIDSNVLQQSVRYQLALAQFHELTLRKVLVFVGQVELVEVTFKAPLDELFGLLAHDVDLTDDSFVHLVLAVDGLSGVQVLPLGNLPHFRASLRTFFAVLLLIKWVFHILSSFCQFIGDVILAFLTASELDEEVSHAWVGEESLLSLLAVLIHGVSDDLEVHRCAIYHLLNVLLLEVMT